MKHTRWLIVFLVAGTMSCTERIDIELDSTYTRLVVEGRVTTDSIRHYVRLTTTSDYFANEPSPAVSGALVELEFDNTTLVLEEQDTLPGLYLTPEAFRGTTGTNYELHISQVDADADGTTEIYQATSTMPGGLQLDSISLEYFSIYFGSGYQVYLFALDPPGRNWYNLKYWKNSDLLTDSLIKYSVQPDDFYDGTYLFYGIPIGYFDDENPRESLAQGDTVTLQLDCIEQAFYDFVVDAQLEIWGSNPLFSGPSANVRSNIDNGARGTFTAYSIERASAIVIQ